MTNNIQEERYTLASNESGVYRLEILNRIHKPYTEFLLKRAGLESGMVVADIVELEMSLLGWHSKLVILVQ